MFAGPTNLSGISLAHSLMHGVADFGVACAAAYVGLEPMLNQSFVGVRVIDKQRMAYKQETGSAEAALKAVIIDERLLYGRVYQSFYRCDPMPYRLDCKHKAGFDRPAVNKDRAGAAVSVFAAGFCAGKSQLAPQHFKEYIRRTDSDIVTDPVHIQGDYIFPFILNHIYAPSASSAFSIVLRRTSFRYPAPDE